MRRRQIVILVAVCVAATFAAGGILGLLLAGSAHAPSVATDSDGAETFLINPKPRTNDNCAYYVNDNVTSPCLAGLESVLAEARYMYTATDGSYKPDVFLKVRAGVEKSVDSSQSPPVETWRITTVYTVRAVNQ